MVLEVHHPGLVLRYSPGIYLEGLRKTTKNLSQYSRCPGRDLKPRSQILMLFTNEVAISEATRVKSDKTIQ
jgi:hypothetical protein